MVVTSTQAGPGVFVSIATVQDSKVLIVRIILPFARNGCLHTESITLCSMMLLYFQNWNDIDDDDDDDDTDDDDEEEEDGN
jgi:hypothetical protein